MFWGEGPRSGPDDIVRIEENVIHFLDTYFQTLRENVMKQLEQQAMESGTMRVTADMAMKCVEKITLNAINR